MWALGCVVYEMATLKHAFDARDMNGLVCKIIRGKVSTMSDSHQQIVSTLCTQIPPMPRNYSADLCDMIKSMLSQSPARRPSITRLLKTDFIKSHIRLFLEERRGKKSSAKCRTSASDSDCSSSSRTDSPQPSLPVSQDRGKVGGLLGESLGPDVPGNPIRSSSDSNASSELVGHFVLISK